MPGEIEAQDIGGGYAARPRSDVAWVELDGDVVVYDPVQSTSYVLNSSAGLIWRFLDGTATVDELAADIADVFGANTDQVRGDVMAAVQRFGRQGLLVGVRADAEGDGAATPPASEDAHPLPRLLLGPEGP